MDFIFFLHDFIQKKSQKKYFSFYSYLIFEKHKIIFAKFLNLLNVKSTYFIKFFIFQLFSKDNYFRPKNFENLIFNIFSFIEKKKLKFLPNLKLFFYVFLILKKYNEKIKYRKNDYCKTFLNINKKNFKVKKKSFDNIILFIFTNKNINMLLK